MMVMMWRLVRLGVFLAGAVVIWSHSGAIEDAVISRVDPSYQPGQVQVTMHQAVQGIQEASLVLGGD